jgi:hypothetical protein
VGSFALDETGREIDMVDQRIGNVPIIYPDSVTRIDHVVEAIVFALATQ